jgi:hypothetical protein
MSRICLYYRQEPERDRWIPGDRFVRPYLRRAIRGQPGPRGVDKVFMNLCLGLDRLGTSHEVNLPFDRLRSDDRVGVLGRGRHSLKGYRQPNPVVAGIGLMTHPSEWPALCDEYPVVTYLQHSEWANELYRPYFGDRCRVWPVGIDTCAWRPAPAAEKRYDFLIYDKIRWDRVSIVPRILGAVCQELEKRGLTFRQIRYGGYDEWHYREALRQSRLMIFLCEHESQGLAYQECLASGVPVLAWDQGWCLDPNRFAWGQPEIPATSVPYFDARCGLRFRGPADFPDRLSEFLDRARAVLFEPREYVVENLTVEKCAADFLNILEQVQRPAALPWQRRSRSA